MILAASLTLATAAAAALFTPLVTIGPSVGPVLELGLALALFSAVCAGEGQV